MIATRIPDGTLEDEGVGVTTKSSGPCSVPHCGHDVEGVDERKRKRGGGGYYSPGVASIHWR